MTNNKKNNKTDKKNKTTRKRRGVKKEVHFDPTLKPKLYAYDAQYKNNPMVAVLQKIYDGGRLELGMEERKYLADLIVEELSNQVEFSGMGAPITRRLITWLKGLQRSDVIR
jgi:hypothetical protein